MRGVFIIMFMIDYKSSLSIIIVYFLEHQSKQMKSGLNMKIILESAEYKLQRARQLKNQHKYQQAIQFYHKVIFLKQTEDTLIEMAEIYETLCDLSTAILFYKRSYQINPRIDIMQKVQALSLTKGLQLLNVGSTKNILIDTEFEVFTKRYPSFQKRLLNNIKQSERNKEAMDQINNLLLSSLAYLQVNQQKLAIDSIDKCQRINNKNVDVIILKGILNWSLMENKKGYECFWAAYKIQPNNEQVKAFLQMIIPRVEELYKESKYQLINKDYGKCRLKVRKALQMYPHHTRFLILSSYLYRVKEQYQEALGELEVANRTLSKDDLSLEDELRNQISLTYNQMGIYLFKHSKFEEAIKLFTEGLSYKPMDWGMYCNRGDCHKGLNDYVKALEDYQKAYEIEKKNEGLNFRLSNIFNLRGIALFNAKKYENALQQFNESIRFSPRCITFYISKAKCFIQLGLKSDGLICLTQAQQIQPANAQILQLMGQVKQEEEKKLRNNRKVIMLSKQK